MSDERRVRLVLEGTVTSYFYPSVQPREALNCFSRHGFERLSITLCKNRCRKAGEAACLGLAASSLAGCFFQGACGALVVGCGVATCCALGGTAAGWTRLDAGDLVGTLPFGRSAAGFVRALRAWFLAGRHRCAVLPLCRRWHHVAQAQEVALDFFDPTIKAPWFGRLWLTWGRSLVARQLQVVAVNA